MAEERVCLAEMVGVHGVKGLVRVRPFTEEPEAFAAYGTLQDEQGRPVRLEAVGRAKGTVLARVEGVADRDQAEALRGTRLYVARAALPAIEEAETYYHADLIGLRAESPEGERLGRVKAVQNYGAGDLLEVEAKPAAGHKRGEILLVPFSRAAVPEVDLATGRVVVVLQEVSEPVDEPVGEEAGHDG